MGVVQSMFCSATFCVERVLTWTCCACVLLVMMACIVLLMIYGISVGYHYAQRELVIFALESRTTTGSARLVSDPGNRAVVRLVAVNRSEEEHAPYPIIESPHVGNPDETIYLATSKMPIVYLETEPTKPPELLPHEKDLARRIVGRVRRSRANSSLVTTTPFLRPLRAITTVLTFSAT